MPGEGEEGAAVVVGEAESRLLPPKTLEEPGYSPAPWPPVAAGAPTWLVHHAQAGTSLDPGSVD